MTLLLFISELPARVLVARPIRGQRAGTEVGRKRPSFATLLRFALLVAFFAGLAGIADPRTVVARAATTPQAAVQSTSEHEVKAQFLLRFATPYVKWPEAAFDDKTSPFIVGALGKDPFGKKLDELFKDKKVGEHPIEIVRFSSVDHLDRCHMLFVPEAQEKQLRKIDERYKDKSTLIVAESIAAAQSGAHIGFYLEKSKVRFAINPSAAKPVKLEISSELLKLAKVVENKAESEE